MVKHLIEPSSLGRLQIYGIVDLNASYDIPVDFNGITASVVLNVRNLFDEVYIQDATDNSRYNAVPFRVNSKIHIIYNSYDFKKYNFSSKKISLFKKKYGLTSFKPIIYIGVADPKKGVNEVFHALKDDGYQIVMTGGNNNADKNVNALFLSLEPDELRVLYSAVDAVVVMSKLNEGWNRVAHEAILSSTVVIGSGVSGMAELLQVSNQYYL